MKVTQYMMDYRLIQTIQTLNEYHQIFIEAGMPQKASHCRAASDDLKIVAFDTAEVITVTEIDDLELIDFDEREPISLPGVGFTLWTDWVLYFRVKANNAPFGIDIQTLTRGTPNVLHCAGTDDEGRLSINAVEYFPW